MSDGPIFRSDDDVAEAITVRNDHIDVVIHRESELGAYALEDVRELGKWTI
jgi:hypothetical protein